MMTKLREFSKVFIIIVVLSFIGLMVFEWGADYSGRSRVDDVVGSVNDIELTYEIFSEFYQQLYQNQRAQTGKTTFDENDLQQLRNQVWEQFIQRTLFEEQMDKLGISVSDSEIVYQIYNYPLEQLKQHPSFQTDGVFDINKYRASFSNPNVPWGQIEQIYRQQIPFLKLQNIIANTVRVSEEEILDEFKKQNLKAKVEYISVLPGTFNKDLEASEEEIKAFYEENKDEYKQNEMRDLSYCIFPITTTTRDTVLIHEEFARIKERLNNGDSFAQLALEYSEDPSASKNNGDLGYFEHGSMVKPFSDAAFAANKGDIVGPVLTSFGFHLIYVEDKKTEDGKEMVKASHILMKVTPAPSAMEEQESKARYFADDAKEGSFAQIAEKEDYEVLTTGLFEERSGFVPGIGRNLSVTNFTFAGNLNDVSGVYSLDNGYAVFAITTINPEGYRDIESVKRLIENRIKLEKAKVLAEEFASGLNEQVQSGKPLKEIAESSENGIVNYDITPQFTINGRLPRIGTNVDFTANAFTLDMDQVSGLISSDRGFYYQKLLEKTDFDSNMYKIQKANTERQILNNKRTRIFAEWYENLKENADIVDNRKKFGI